MKKTSIVLIILISIFFVSCTNKQKTNIFEDYHLLMKKNDIVKLLEEKEIDFTMPTEEEQIKKNESLAESIGKKALEDMPEEYITYNDAFFSIKTVAIRLYFFESSLYKIEVNSYPLSEKKESRTAEIKKNLDIIKESVDKYFVNSEYEEYKDYFGNKHYYYSLDGKLGDYIDIECNDYGIKFEYIEPLQSIRVKKQKEEYAEKIRRLDPDYTGKWYVLKDHYVELENTEGKFSNSVTTDSKLKANLKYSINNEFTIELYEYGKNQVKGSWSDEKKYTVYIRNNEKTIGLKGYNHYHAIEFSAEDSKKIMDFLLSYQENITFHILAFDYSKADYLFTIKDAYGLEAAIRQMKNK